MAMLLRPTQHIDETVGCPGGVDTVRRLSARDPHGNGPPSAGGQLDLPKALHPFVK